MKMYGDVAVKAVELMRSGEENHPESAWDHAASSLFPNSSSLQDKGCPKGAFLGLCNEGLIIDLPASDYSRPSKNGEYAVNAVSILKSNRFLASQPDLLWKKVAGNTKASNSQMEVVASLWEAKCIRRY